jgi:hypothetical protein
MNRPTIVDSNMRDHMLGLTWGLLVVSSIVPVPNDRRKSGSGRFGQRYFISHVASFAGMLCLIPPSCTSTDPMFTGGKYLLRVRMLQPPEDKFTDLPRRRRCASGPVKLERQFNVQRATHACPTVISSHAC